MFTALFFGVLLRISWLAPADGTPPTGYRVLIGTSSASYSQVVDVGNVLTKDIDVDIASAKFIAVSAYNQWGDSAPSTEITVGKPRPPRNLAVVVSGSR